MHAAQHARRRPSSPKRQTTRVPRLPPLRYDKTIQETEAAYSKIMESSQTLLHVLKRESVNLTKKRQASS